MPAGIGTGALRLAPFDDPTSFLRAVDGAEIVRTPRSMLRLQIEKRRRAAPRNYAAEAARTAGIGGRRSNSDAVPADELYERYLARAISEVNALGDEIARRGDAPRASPCSAPGTRWATSSCSSTTPRPPS